MKLNLGCGHDLRDGWVNVDRKIPARYANEERYETLEHDLTDLPWPWEGHTVSKILLDNVLEHLPDPFETLKEAYRVLEGGAVIKIYVPHHKSRKARLITHRHLYDKNSLDPLIHGRHRTRTSLENEGIYDLVSISVTHTHPFAWHQREYLGREVLAWRPHEIEYVLKARKETWQ